MKNQAHHPGVRFKVIGALCAAGVLAAACGGEAPPAKPAATAAAQKSDRYSATLQEGIQFNREGWPEFVASVSGISGREAWGRWTDTPKAKIVFRQPLPRKFTVEVVGGAFGPNQGQPVPFSIGPFTTKVNFAGTPFKDPETHRFDVDLAGDANAIEISIPQPTSPSSSDKRTLGIGLVRLSVFPRT